MPTAWLPWPGKMKAMLIGGWMIGFRHVAAKDTVSIFSVKRGLRAARSALAANRKDSAHPQPPRAKESFPAPHRSQCATRRMEICMTRPVFLGALTATLAVVAASLPLLAADPQPWPWT